ncbi:hypothetical protein N9D66_00345 [Candidatus Nanopelagicales bacterium]|nr:hypothetical protein [Candidatus Nanopelagicales bacterium]
MTFLVLDVLNSASEDGSRPLSQLLLRVAAILLVAALIAIAVIRIVRQRRATSRRQAIEEGRMAVLEVAENAAVSQARPEKDTGRGFTFPPDTELTFQRALGVRGGREAMEDALASAVTVFNFDARRFLAKTQIIDRVDAAARSKHVRDRLAALRTATRLNLSGYSNVATELLDGANADGVLTSWNYLVNVEAVNPKEVIQYWHTMPDSPVRERLGAFFTSMGTQATDILLGSLDQEGTVAELNLLRWCEPSPRLDTTLARIATEHPTGQVRAAAARAWSVHVPLEHTGAVARAMRDPHDEVRVAAYSAAGSSGVSATAIAPGLDDSDLRARYGAAASLAMTEHGVATLRKAAEAPDLATRMAARSGLAVHYTTSHNRIGDAERLKSVILDSANDHLPASSDTDEMQQLDSASDTAHIEIPNLGLFQRGPNTRPPPLVELWPPEPWEINRPTEISSQDSSPTPTTGAGEES